VVGTTFLGSCTPLLLQQAKTKLTWSDECRLLNIAHSSWLLRSNEKTTQTYLYFGNCQPFSDGIECRGSRIEGGEHGNFTKPDFTKPGRRGLGNNRIFMRWVCSGSECPEPGNPASVRGHPG